MLVWILQTGEPLNCDGEDIRPMRAINLSSALISKNHNVEIISTKFYHQKKTFRKNSKSNFFSVYLSETLIGSTGYRSNIGILRLIDHHILFFNLLIDLFKRKKKPDLIFIGYPPIEWSLAGVIYAKIKKIPIVLDVKDLWPDIFWDKENISTLKKNLLKLIFLPYRIYASVISTFSDYITGPTLSIANYFKTKYSSLILKKLLSIKGPKTFSSPIVPPIDKKINFIQIENKKDPDSNLNILFLGSLMSIYDFETVSESLTLLSQKGINYNLYIGGKGGSEKRIKRLFKKNHNVVFLGWINRDEAIEISKKCHLAIAPYQNILNFKLNLVNKYIDYMSLGLPILSPLEGHVNQLIEKHDIGWNYQANNAKDLAQKISNIYLSKESIKFKSINAYMLFKNKFNYKLVYNELVKNLEIIAK
tara:strand:+ start:9801 stop:11057 length:1257 start_codon:yes stop_codon:yes gene_type:complete